MQTKIFRGKFYYLEPDGGPEAPAFTVDGTWAEVLAGLTGGIAAHYNFSNHGDRYIDSLAGADIIDFTANIYRLISLHEDMFIRTGAHFELEIERHVNEVQIIFTGTRG